MTDRERVGDTGENRPDEANDDLLTPDHVIRHLANLPLGLRAELILRLIQDDGPDALAALREGTRHRFLTHCRSRGIDPGGLDRRGMQRVVIEMLTLEDGTQ